MKTFPINLRNDSIVCTPKNTNLKARASSTKSMLRNNRALHQATMKNTVTPLRHSLIGDVVGALVAGVLGCALTAMFLYIN